MAIIFKNKGLTLIEVMIATFILTLSFIAVLSTGSYISHALIRIEEKTLAAWCAQNLSAKLQWGLLGEMNSAGILQGTCDMGNQIFLWNAVGNSRDNFLSVDLNIRPKSKNDSIFSLTTYLMDNDYDVTEP